MIDTHPPRAGGTAQCAVGAEPTWPADSGLLQALLDSPSLGILALRAVRDAAGRITDFQWRTCNAAAATMLGCAAAPDDGRTLRTDLPGARGEDLFARCVAVVETGAALREDVCVGPDAAQAWFDAVAVRHGDGLVVTLSDVTQRRQAEEALAHNRHLLRTVIDHVPAWLALTDREGRYIVANRWYTETLGKPLEEIEGRLWRAVFPQLEPRHAPLIDRCMSGETVVFDDVLPLEPGRPHHAHGVYTPLRAADGEVRHMTCIALDITARVEVEDALAAEKERLAVTLRCIGDGVITTDAEGRVTFLNGVAAELTGWSAAEAVGRPLAEVFRTLDEQTRQPREDAVAKALAGDRVVGLANSTLLVARDGRERLLTDSAAPLRDPSGRTAGVVLVFRDVTDTRRIEEELRTAQKLESVGVLAGGIAHDFNNLLTAILGNLTLARLEQQPDSRADQSLHAAEKAVLRARDLTQQLLTFSTGGAPVKQSLRIGDLIAESVGFAVHGARSRAEVAVAPDLWTVEVDPGQMSQVIANLVINADESMPDGGVIRVSARNVPPGPPLSAKLPSGPYVEIAVQDQGLGIAPEHLQRVFDPYFTTKPKSSGLGLTTCRAIVRKHGGDIRVESAPGRGATFRVFLPALAGARESVVRDAGVRPGRGRLLVMDDEAIVRDVCSAMLVRLGYEVETAYDGAEALTAYSRARAAGRPFDLVVMDLTIPGGMGGKEAVGRLLDIDPQARAIVVSGYSNDPVLSDFRAHGFRGFVVKPFTLEVLSEAVRNALA